MRTFLLILLPLLLSFKISIFQNFSYASQTNIFSYNLDYILNFNGDFFFFLSKAKMQYLFPQTNSKSLISASLDIFTALDASNSSYDQFSCSWLHFRSRKTGSKLPDCDTRLNFKSLSQLFPYRHQNWMYQELIKNLLKCLHC